MALFRFAALASVSVLSLSAHAYAQAVPRADLAAEATASGDTQSGDEIVVTGTLVRGVAPAGTNVVAVTQQQVQSSGATTVTEVLNKVPQFGSFNDLQGTTSAGTTVTTNRPNLRNLPGQTTSGTSATLLLIDGHRVVGMGISSTTPDADFLPPGIIERVEIVPDGGSALYGSDAVAGVVNFITMKRFDGVKVDARYGFGKDFHTFDADATVGKDWGTGSIWASYNYTENSAILGKDRDYNFTPLATQLGTTLRSLSCVKPNIQITGAGLPAALYSAPVASARGTANICDNTDEASLFPAQRRHSVYVGLNQQLNDWLEVNIRSFWYRKEVDYVIGEIGAVANVGTAPGSVFSPYNVNVTGDPNESKVINLTFGPDHLAHKPSSLEAWGHAIDFKAGLTSDWQLRTHFGYSQSETVADSESINLALLPGMVTSGAVNPFAPQTSSPAALAQLFDFEDYGRAWQRQLNIRAVADGSLFELPGGTVKVAIGAEYTAEGYDIRKGNTVASVHDMRPKFRISRNVKSVFGEIVAPVLGGDSGVSLTVSASGRYDSYSDVGGTFNPKFGATFKPVDWISIRGAWGKSFVAPSMADNAIADPTDARYIAGPLVNFFLAPAGALAANGYPPVQPGQNIIILLGSNPGLKPQKATTWSIGADINPPFIPGLRLSTTYYNITYTDIIGLVPFTNAPVYWSTYAPQSFTLNPTLAQIAAVAAQDPDGILGTPCAPLPSCVYGIQDVRKQNISGFKQSGIDFAADYLTTTNFGSIDFNLAGTYILTRAGAPSATAPYVSELANFNSRLKLRASLGANIGQLRAQAAWNFSQGFNVPPAGLVQQTHVGDFNTVDLFFKYDFNREDAFKDLELNLTVSNLFDQDPPLYYGTDISSRSGFSNGNTYGRLVQLGFKKKF